MITGGCGFIASNYINYFSTKFPDINIINIDAMYYCAHESNIIEKVRYSDKYHFIKGNVQSEDLINHILYKYEISHVIHFAAQSHVQSSFNDALLYTRDNILGTHILLECCRKYGKLIKFIHVSTDEVYGDIKKSLQVSESYNYNPSSPYSASKAGADQLIKSYYRTYGSKIITANSCNNYGPNQLPEKFIPKIIFNIIKNKPIPLYGKGTNVREWIFVKDNCEALIKIFNKGKTGKNYNVGTGVRVKNLDIIKLIFKIARNHKITIKKNAKIKFVKDRPGHDKRYAIDSSKIRKELKWKYKISLRERLEKTFRWYLNNQNYFKQISNNNINKRFGLKI